MIYFWRKFGILNHRNTGMPCAFFIGGRGKEK